MFSIGLDYGSDSARAVIVDTKNGQVVGTAVAAYPRWAEGKYCEPTAQQFRQHPQDYIDVLIETVSNALKQAPAGAAEQICGIGIDTTGSTPVAVTEDGTPLGLTPAFTENPNALFVLWKDHTAHAESDRINELAHNGTYTDYTAYSGGIHSPEWFWAKAAHILNTDSAVREATFSFVEHCDWLPAVLCGNTNPLTIKLSRCTSGHKALWHSDWDGAPSDAFLTDVCPHLAGMRNRMSQETHTSDTPAGTLCETWAQQLGLPIGIPVCVGMLDAHMGAVGASAQAGSWCKVIGTSTCDMVVAEGQPDIIPGICGQVDGSIIPDAVGLEAGQAAFGDIFAWFQTLLSWGCSDRERQSALLGKLSQAAEKLPIGAHGVAAVDWFNGRRSPDVDPSARGALSGLQLGSDAPAVFRALVESAAFGSRAIQERFAAHGVHSNRIIALGGIAQKSPFIMQILADVLRCQIAVSDSDQTCALGAAMFAAVASKQQDNLQAAQEQMGAGIAANYYPQEENSQQYDVLYQHYCR